MKPCQTWPFEMFPFGSSHHGVRKPKALGSEATLRYQSGFSKVEYN